MLNFTPIWFIAIAIVALVAVCGEIGFQIGKRAKASLGESPFTVLQAAIFGLLGLLLAFSFSLGLARYDTRRAEVSREADSIRTTLLRTQLLEPQAAALTRKYLARYIDARIDFAANTVDLDAQSEAAARSSSLQLQMWNLAIAQAAHDTHSTTIPLYLTALGQTIEESDEEEAALSAHVPDAVVVVLAFVIAFASVLLGVGFGRTDRRGALAIAFFAIMLALVVGTNLDLDRPQRGYIRVSLAPLQAVQTQARSIADGVPPPGKR